MILFQISRRSIFYKERVLHILQSLVKALVKSLDMNGSYNQPQQTRYSSYLQSLPRLNFYSWYFLT